MAENLYTLYGDGIHDDTAAIQEMIDTSYEVCLPEPKVHYLISKPLELHSGVRLVLPRFAEIRLADGSNCVMLKNRTVEDVEERITSKVFCYVNRYSPDAPCENIEVVGGIWNFNNKNQNENPIYTKIYEPAGYTGFGFLFYNVRNLRISSLTLKDPVNFAMTLDTLSYFKVDHITFDFNEGNPYQSNMDGIHLCGHCHHGSVENLFGTCYDDIVALNSEEGSRGPITDITIRGIYTQDSYSAVRLMSASPRCTVRNIHISDVHGTFYHFCIAFMRCYYTGERGVFEGITIDNIYASRADRNLVRFPLVFGYPEYPLIDMHSEIDYKNIKITDVHRREYVTATPTVKVHSDTTIENMVLENITSENHTDSKEMPVFVNEGTIKYLSAKNLIENGREILI